MRKILHMPLKNAVCACAKYCTCSLETLSVHAQNTVHAPLQIAYAYFCSDSIVFWLDENSLLCGALHIIYSKMLKPLFFRKKPKNFTWAIVLPCFQIVKKHCRQHIFQPTKYAFFSPWLTTLERKSWNNVPVTLCGCVKSNSIFEVPAPLF